LYAKILIHIGSLEIALGRKTKSIFREPTRYRINGLTIFATAILDLVSQFQMRLTSAAVVASRLFAGEFPKKLHDAAPA
jgi:hypothetical protein